MVCGSGGSKSRLAKAAGAEPSGQMRDEKLHAVVAEEHFEVKSVKTWGSQTTFGSWDDEKKVHAVVARSTFPSQNAQRTPFSEHVWKLRCRKSARCCGAKHISKSKCTKTDWFGGLLDVEMSFRKVVAGASKGFCVHLLPKAALSKVGRRGTFEEARKRCISRGRRNTRDMFSRDVRRSGQRFPERGCILEHQIFRFAKMILRDRCSTSYDLASLFRGRRSTLDRWNGKIAKRIGTRPSALFWRKSRRIALFLMLSTSTIEEVLRNSFVFDVVKFENWGSLAELLRFWCCQVQKLRKSRRIASFSTCR